MKGTRTHGQPERQTLICSFQCLVHVSRSQMLGNWFRITVRVNIDITEWWEIILTALDDSRRTEDED